MTTLPFEYPVIGFNRRVGQHGEGEYIRVFDDERSLTTWDRWSLEHGALTGMLLVDNTGRNWEIRSAKRLQASGSPLAKAIRFLFRQQSYKVDLEIVEKDPITLDEVKTRFCRWMDDNPDDWRDDEAIAGEAGPPRDEQEMLEELKDQVRKGRTLAEAMDNLDAALAAHD